MAVDPWDSARDAGVPRTLSTSGFAVTRRLSYSACIRLQSDTLCYGAGWRLSPTMPSHPTCLCPIVVRHRGHIASPSDGLQTATHAMHRLPLPFELTPRRDFPSARRSPARAFFLSARTDRGPPPALLRRAPTPHHAETRAYKGASPYPAPLRLIEASGRCASSPKTRAHHDYNFLPYRPSLRPSAAPRSAGGESRCGLAGLRGASRAGRRPRRARGAPVGLLGRRQLRPRGLRCLGRGHPQPPLHHR